MPGDRFDTPEEAGRDAVEYYNDVSIEENVEYSGSIIREVTVVEKEDGSTEEVVQYYATKGTQGEKDNFSVPISKNNTVGIYHTHGDYSKETSSGRIIRATKSTDEFDSDNLSTRDKRITRAAAKHTRNARARYGESFIMVLGTPSGEIKSYTYD